MKKSILLLFTCLPLILFAQRKEGKALVDSLLKELSQAKEDTGKADLLDALGKCYLNIDPTEGVKYGDSALDLAKRLKFKAGIARTYNLLAALYNALGNISKAGEYGSTAVNLYEEIGDKAGIASSEVTMGIIHISKGDYLQGTEFLKKALGISIEIGDKEKMASCYSSIGTTYYYLGNYPEALNNYFSALKISEKTGAKGKIADCYSNIGMLYTKQKNYSEGLKYDSAALKVYEELGRKNTIALVLQNMGGINTNLRNDSEAFKNYRLALKLYEETGDKNGIGDCYNCFAIIYDNEGNYAEALKNFLAALQIFEDIGSRYSIGRSLTYVGNILCKQKKYKEAEKYMLRGLEIAKEIGSPELTMAANENLSDNYARMGNYKKSLDYYNLFVNAKDSLYNEENTKKTVQAQMQYDFDKKESADRAEQAKKETLLEMQLQRKNTFIYGALSAFVLLLAIGGLLIRQNKLRVNQQKSELEQKQLRAQMNPHFIFNCLNSIQHFVVANDVKNANKYLSGFALLMRQTLENSKEGVITLRKEIEYLENYLVLERMRFEDKFTSEVVCAKNVNIDAVEIPSMIIQPFIENAIRHGLCYLQGKKGKLKVSFYVNGNYLYCDVDDNGIGREESQKIKMASEIVYESQGMELTRQRLALVSKSIGSEYKIEIIDKQGAGHQPEGTTIIIKFPINS